MTTSWRSAMRAAAAVVLLAAAACQRQDDGRKAGDTGQQQAGSAGSAQQSSSTRSSSTSPDQGQKSQQAAQQHASAQQSSSSAQRTVEGRIVRAGQDEIVVRQGSGDQPDLRLKVGPETQVTMGGQQRSVGDLQEGTQVRASYDASHGSPQATKIEAMGGSGGNAK